MTSELEKFQTEADHKRRGENTNYQFSDSKRNFQGIVRRLGYPTHNEICCNSLNALKTRSITLP